MSPEQMAAELGVHPNTARNYAGGRTIPTRGTIRVWAMVTGVDEQWLETGEVPTDTSPVTHGQQGAVSAYQRERLAA